ncbi:hypothetical protein [Microbacterium sp. PMB16]|uniref:hypothetical protein n=1 Tax=Microbacterium sp. PMB16 TaxID=3120157 RepID=UPI003F4C5C27
MSTEATTTDATTLEVTTPDVSTPDVTTPDVATPEFGYADAVAPPRTRWAGIIWGALFAAVAASGFWLLVDGDRRSTATDWVLTLTPSMILTLAILTAGVLVLFAGAVGLLRRGQRRMAAHAAQRRASAPASE